MQKTVRSPGEAEAGYLAALVQTSEESWCMRERFTTYFVYNQQKQKMTTSTKVSLSLSPLRRIQKGRASGHSLQCQKGFRKTHFLWDREEMYQTSSTPHHPTPVSLPLPLCLPLPFPPPPFSHTCTHTHYNFIRLLRIHIKLLGIRLQKIKQKHQELKRDAAQTIWR